MVSLEVEVEMARQGQVNGAHAPQAA